MAHSNPSGHISNLGDAGRFVVAIGTLLVDAFGSDLRVIHEFDNWRARGTSTSSSP